ncbi:MAG: cell wall hydrolase [Bacilli bacterium]|nr:cell wall hydrolase [Bacilli bacterium]
MSIIDYTTKEIDLLARLMRAEAVGEGELGMLMVGNVGVNRVLADCLDFPTIRSVTNMIYQSPGGFTGTNSPLFQSAATTQEKRLAEEVLMGRTYYPATHALWFYAPKTGEECRALWFNQRNSGRYKSHCFYRPDLGVCPQLIR